MINMPKERNMEIPEYLSLNTVVLSNIMNIIKTSELYNPLINFILYTSPLGKF